MRALAEKDRAALEHPAPCWDHRPFLTLTLWHFQFTIWLSWEGWEAGVNA